MRVQLVPFVEEAEPGPKAPEAAPAPPPAPTPPPRAAAAPRPKPPARPAVARAAAPRRAVPAAPTPNPVAAPAPEEPGAEHAGPATGAGLAPVSSPPPAGAGGAGAGGDEIAAYVSRVRALLARHKEYPALARRRGLEGTVLLHLRIGADGRVERARAANGAPQPFAKSALAAIDRAGRFPAPPRGPLSIEVPIRFRLQDP